MNEVILTQNDEIVMKLLHYFIIEHGYHPVILHGAKNEIWLENLEENYKIIRIAFDYIHNDEQFKLDVFRTERIMQKIKRRTVSFKMNMISFFINLGDNVHLKTDETIGHVLCLNVKEIDDLNRFAVVKTEFPDIMNHTSFKEKGVELFLKITGDINKVSEVESRRAEDVFKKTVPIVTYLILILNIVFFFAMYIFGNGSNDIDTLIQFGAHYAPLIFNGEYWRLLTSAFLHIGVLHLALNMYALYIIGSQLEGFFGRGKYLAIYLFSALTGNLLTIPFSQNTVSAGASGAIFGLMGALLYFGYHYRVYLGSVIKSQIIPLILLNLLSGFLISGINNAAHIGGLIGGTLISIALGVKYKSTKGETINGWVLTTIYAIFLFYFGFFVGVS